MLIAALAGPALAQEEPPCRVEVSMRAVAEFLALTPEQVDAWQSAMEARRAAAEPLGGELGDVRAQLAMLLDEAEPDAVAVGELTIQAHGIREALRQVNESYLDTFNGLLDEDQANKVAFLQRADRVQPLLPAFRVFGLLASPPPPPEH